MAKKSFFLKLIQSMGNNYFTPLLILGLISILVFIILIKNKSTSNLKQQTPQQFTLSEELSPGYIGNCHGVANLADPLLSWSYPAGKVVYWSVLQPKICNYPDDPINKCSDSFNWSTLDAEIARAANAGKRIWIQVSTDDGAGFDPVIGGTIPQWALDAGMKAYFPSQRINPVQWDPKYKEFLQTFLKAMADRYDNDNGNNKYIEAILMMSGGYYGEATLTDRPTHLNWVDRYYQAMADIKGVTVERLQGAPTAEKIYTWQKTPTEKASRNVYRTLFEQYVIENMYDLVDIYATNFNQKPVVFQMGGLVWAPGNSDGFNWAVMDYATGKYGNHVWGKQNGWLDEGTSQTYDKILSLFKTKTRLSREGGHYDVWKTYTKEDILRLIENSLDAGISAVCFQSTPWQDPVTYFHFTNKAEWQNYAEKTILSRLSNNYSKYYPKSDRSQELCQTAGGIWKNFANSCANKCNQGSSCSQISTISCDCGSNKCWNGSQCLPCKNEGQIVTEDNCCTGFTKLPTKDHTPTNNQYFCSAKCGDGLCNETTENTTNCPSDCKSEPPQCQKNSQCNWGQMCIDNKCQAINTNLSKINIKIKLLGIDTITSTSPKNHITEETKIKTKVTIIEHAENQDDIKTLSKDDLEFSFDKNGFFLSSTLNIAQFSSGSKFDILIKPEKHLSKVFKDISLNNNLFNLTNDKLLPGDLPWKDNQQDGILDLEDWQQFDSRMGSIKVEDLKICDVNYDGLVNTLDKSLVRSSFGPKKDEQL